MHHLKGYRAESTNFPFFPKSNWHNSVKNHRTKPIFKLDLNFLVNNLHMKVLLYMHPFKR